MREAQTAAAPETLLASPDMPHQQQITDEIARFHREAEERAAAGEAVPRTLYDFPPYRSSVLRHPTKNPRLVDPETIELHSPAFGQRDVAAIESDLTLQHAGEPLGERITVAGRLASTTRPGLARAAMEGMLCGLADGLDAIVALGARVDRAILVGGGARSAAVGAIAAQVLGVDVVVPAPAEDVARGAALQAAWARTGERPAWPRERGATHAADPRPRIREQYAERSGRL